MTDEERERLLRELHRRGFGELSFGARHGCSGSELGFAGTPRACGQEPEYVAIHEYQWPTRARYRMFLCPAHAELKPDAQPMTDADRAELDARRIQYMRHEAGLPYDPVMPIDESLDDPS